MVWAKSGICRGATLRGTTFRGPSTGPPLRQTAQNFALFSLCRPHFRSFSLLSGSLLVEFWWCFGLSGCRVKPRRLLQEQFYN